MAASAAMLFCACAQEAPFGRVEAGVKFHRLAVLPFSDARGRGVEVSKLLAVELAHRDFNPVEQGQLDVLIAAMNLEPGSEIGLSTLGDIRRSTFADAIVVGSVDSRWSAANVVLIDTKTGATLFSARVEPGRGSFASVQEIVERVAEAFSGWQR